MDPATGRLQTRQVSDTFNAKRGLLAGEAGKATDYEMSLIARAVANGQRAWSSVKFYYPTGADGAMERKLIDQPDPSKLGKLDPVDGGKLTYCHHC